MPPALGNGGERVKRQTVGSPACRQWRDRDPCYPISVAMDAREGPIELRVLASFIAAAGCGQSLRLPLSTSYGTGRARLRLHNVLHARQDNSGQEIG